MIHAAWLWFLHVTGSDNTSGVWYGFWSGFGSIVVQPAMLVALLVALRHTNCHVHRCWRLGKHPVDGTPYRVCQKHHPGIPDKVTPEHIKRAAKA